MAVGCNNAVSIFVYYNAIGIHTEGTDIVLKLFRSVYNLAFVELIGEMREDYCRKFYPDSQIYPVGKGGDGELPADRFHPFTAAAAYGDNTFFTVRRSISKKYPETRR